MTDSDIKIENIQVIDEDNSYTNTIIYLVISTVLLFIFYKLGKSIL